jgi:hypothetical protein
MLISTNYSNCAFVARWGVSKMLEVLAAFVTNSSLMTTETGDLKVARAVI